MEQNNNADSSYAKGSTSMTATAINKSDEYTPEFKLKAGIFLASVSGLSALIGFGTTLAAVKKQDPENFDRGMMRSMVQLHESGAGLAARALGWGTLYAFTGCGILFFTIWKLSGAHSMAEFRNKVGAALPKVPRNNPPQGRTEFSGINDLLDYLQHQRSSNDK